MSLYVSKPMVFSSRELAWRLKDGRLHILKLEYFEGDIDEAAAIFKELDLSIGEEKVKAVIESKGYKIQGVKISIE